MAVSSMNRLLTSGCLAALYGMSFASAASESQDAAANGCAPFDSYVSEKVPVPAAYPFSNRSIQGWVIAEFFVASDGRAREPRILYATPLEAFDENVMRAILETEFEPATRGGTPVGAWKSYSVLFPRGENGRRLIEEFEATVQQRAESGSAANQYLHSVIVAVGGLASKNAADRRSGVEWRRKAAEAGSAPAQFWLARERLSRNCPDWEPEGLEWLRKAAQAEYMPAQAELTRISPQDQPLAAATGSLAGRWVELKARDSDLAAGRALAEALIKANLEVEARAVPIVRKLISRQDYYPPVYELRAAAHARLSRFADAVKDQQKALKMAGELKWDTGPQEQRLQAYQQNRAWEGDILLPR